MHEPFLNKNINGKVFGRIPHFWQNDLFESSQAKIEQMVNLVNDGVSDLRNAVNKKGNPKEKNPDEINSIVKNILDFNKQEQSNWLKIVIPKQIIQRLHN